MIHTGNNETFLSYGELFSRAAQRCFAAERSVRGHMRETDEPYSHAVALVAEEEHKLALELAQYAEKGPENIVCTRIQYKPDSDDLSRSDTLEGALKNITQVNLELAAVIGDLAHKAAPESLRETLETLSTDIEAANRRISTIRLTMRDI